MAAAAVVVDRESAELGKSLLTETDESAELEKSEKKPPASMMWRLFHVTCFSLAGFQFLIGAILVFPELWRNGSQKEIFLYNSGVVYTVGSVFFAVADATEWWYFRDFSLGDDLNFFANIVGSVLYIAGSYYGIPSVERTFWEILLLWAASATVVLSQTLKIIRPSWGSFNTYLTRAGYPTFFLDFATALGASGYLAGTTCYLLPEKRRIQTHYACRDTGIALFFFYGASFFLTAGLIMIYKYFFYLPHSHHPTNFGPFLWFYNA